MNYFNLLLKRIVLNSFLESFNNYAMDLKVFLFHCTLGSTEDFVFYICIVHKQKISYIFTLTCLLVRLNMFFILACNCFFFIEVKFIYSEMHRFFFPPHHVVCRILVPQPRITPGFLAIEAQNPNHRTTTCTDLKFTV